MVAVAVGLINEGQFWVVVSRLVGASVGSEGELGEGGRWCPGEGGGSSHHLQSQCHS